MDGSTSKWSAQSRQELVGSHDEASKVDVQHEHAAGSELNNNCNCEGVIAMVDAESAATRLQRVRIADEPERAWQEVVPKCFRLLMIDPHSTEVSNLRRRIDAQSTSGTPESTSAPTGLPFGFDPAELIRKHALNPDVSGVSQQHCSTLENEIHPIFGHSNFVDCPNEVYEIIKPALRLTSVVLLNRATSTFWHTLAFGKREVFLLNSQTGKQAVRIQEDVEWTENNQQIFNDRLSNIKKYVRFYFGIETPDENAYGLCVAPNENRRFVLPLDPIQLRYAQVYIGFDFYTTAVRLGQTKHSDPNMVLRFTFLLAVTLLHEVAHFLEFSHNFEYIGEPYFSTREWGEIGLMFEQKTFGGTITSINTRVDCAYGLCIVDLDEGNTFWSIPMEYIICCNSRVLGSSRTSLKTRKPSTSLEKAHAHLTP